MPDTTKPSEPSIRQIHLMGALNRVIQPELRRWNTADFNQLGDLFENFKIVLGGDSACLHIDGPILQVGPCEGVTDCNPMDPKDSFTEGLWGE